MMLNTVWINICDYTLEKYDQKPLLVENYNTGINL